MAMAMATPTNLHAGDIISIRFLVDEISKRKCEERKLIIAEAICALLNSNGGTVQIRGEDTKGNLDSTTILDSWTRRLEQSLTSRFGAQITESINVNFEDKNEKMIKIRVSKSRFLITIKYNLYRPTEKQVGIIVNVQNALEIMNRRFVDQPVQLGSHQKTFLTKQNSCLRENEVIQFKLLKSDSSKHVTLADRMIGKSNKFSCYVSAFANHRGGHIYYGIDDDGVVKGENTENISEIKKKVKKAIQKMIWPDGIGQPKRGEHWEIFFEPVLDEKSNHIPSTFVIVIFIAPCCGGVFAEEPESYEMVEGKVERMSFTTWKGKLQPVGLNKRKIEVPSAMKRFSLSPLVKKRCLWVYEVLTVAINNERWDIFPAIAEKIKQEYPQAGNPEVNLVVLSRKAMANCRRGNIHQAYNLHTEYQECFSQAEQPMVALLQFMEAEIARVSGKSAENQVIATNALTIAELIEPGLCTAALYLVAASIYDDSQNDSRLSPDVLCTKALEHLEYVEDAPVARADLYHNAHITLAAYHLGYNLSGKMIKKVIDKEDLKKAKTSIMTVNQSVCDGNPPTAYRKIWLELVQSFLYIRYSQLQTEGRQKFVNAAIQFAKRAQNLAKESGLVEVIRLAENLIHQLSL